MKFLHELKVIKKKICLIEPIYWALCYMFLINHKIEIYKFFMMSKDFVFYLNYNLHNIALKQIMSYDDKVCLCLHLSCDRLQNIV